MLKSILASLTGHASDKTVMESAFAVAGPAAAHIEALHTRIDAAEAAAIAQIAATHVYGSLQDVSRNIAQEEQILSRAAQTAYATACARHGAKGDVKVATTYREVTTLANETLHQARVHDLTVTARVPELARERLDALIISAGKPVLVAPSVPPGAVGRNVVLAWKNTAEAARAVTAALPILAHAKQVIVAAVAESRTDEDADQESATGVVALLEKHGIHATLRIEVAAQVPVAEKLKEIAYEAQADLLVLGAYGHSRMKELILGGVTRALIADCDIALLMVH